MSNLHTFKLARLPGCGSMRSTMRSLMLAGLLGYRCGLFLIVLAAESGGCGQTESDPAVTGRAVDSSITTNDITLNLKAPKPQLIPKQSDIDAVQSDVRRVSRAMYSGDIDTAISYIPANLIERMGGPSKVRSKLQTTMLDFQASQLTLESLTFPETPTFLKSDGHQFAVVPMKTVIAIKGQRSECFNCMIGVRETGATNWTYIDTSSNDPRKIKALLPDFPVDYQIPKSTRRRL